MPDRDRVDALRLTLREIQAAFHDHWFSEVPELECRTRYELRSMCVVRWNSGIRTVVVGDKAGYLYVLDFDPLDLPLSQLEDSGRWDGQTIGMQSNGVQTPEIGSSVPPNAGNLQPRVEEGSNTPRRWRWRMGPPLAEEPWRELGAIDGLAVIDLQASHQDTAWIAVATRMGGLFFVWLQEPGPDLPAPPSGSTPVPKADLDCCRLRSVSYGGGFLWIGPCDGGLLCCRVEGGKDAPRISPTKIRGLEQIHGILNCMTFHDGRLFCGTRMGEIWSVCPPCEPGTLDGAVTRVAGDEPWRHPIQHLHAIPADAATRGRRDTKSSDSLLVATTFGCHIRSLGGVDDRAHVEPWPFAGGARSVASAIVGDRLTVALAPLDGDMLVIGSEQPNARCSAVHPWEGRRLDLGGAQVLGAHIEPIHDGDGRAARHQDFALVVGTADQRLRVLVHHNEDAPWERLTSDSTLRPSGPGTKSDADQLLELFVHFATRFPYSPRAREGASAVLAEIAQHWSGFALDDEMWCKIESCFHHIAFFSTEEALHNLIKSAEGLAYKDGTIIADRQPRVQNLISHLHKYCLWGKSYSDKKERVRELIEFNKTINPTDASLYRGILSSRRFDQSFARTFEPGHLGETRCFTPIWIRKESPVCPSRPEWFLLTTYLRGKVFLVRWNGGVQSLSTEERWGHVRNVFVGLEHLYLFFSEGRVHRVATGEVIRLADTQSREPLPGDEVASGHFIYSACPAEGDVPVGPADHDHFFCGDREGAIAYFNGRHFIRLPSAPGESGRVAPIHDLRSASLAGRFVLVAACSNARVRLFEASGLDKSGSGTVRVDQLDDLLLGTQDVVTLSCVNDGLFAVASSSGRVHGVRLLQNEGKMRVAWSYRTGGKVWTIRWFRHREERRLEGGRDFLLVGSLDRHVHVLDRWGRQVNSVYLPDSPISRFYCEPQGDGTDLGHFRIACHEDKVIGGQFIDRRPLREAVESEIPEDNTRESWLLARRNTVIAEPFFRNTYCLKSQELNDCAVIDQIESLLGCPVDERTTDYLIALVRRLFAKNWVRRLLGEGRDRTIYYRAMSAYEQARTRWGIPGLEHNQKVQLYWIRAMLRGVDSVEAFRDWLAFEPDRERPPGLYAASTILRVFVSHEAAFIRFKTLEYLERLLFRSEYEPHEKGIFESGDPGAESRASSTTALLNLLLPRVSASGGAFTDQQGDYYWVTDKLCALLFRLMLAGPETLCPPYLYWRAIGEEANSRFFERLAEIMEASEPRVGAVGGEAELAGIGGWADAARHSAQAIRTLGRHGENFVKERSSDSSSGEIKAWIDALSHFCGNCGVARCPWDSFKNDAGQLLPLVAGLLTAGTLADFGPSTPNPRLRELPELAEAGKWKWLPGDAMARSFTELNRVAKRMRELYEANAIDVGPGPLGHLDAGHVRAVEKELERAESVLRPPTSDPNEVSPESQRDALAQRLLSAVVSQWRHVLQSEKDERLLIGFLDAASRVEVDLTPEKLVRHDFAQASEEGKYQGAFQGLFGRLFATSEAARGYLLFHDRGRDEVRLMRADREEWDRDYESKGEGPVVPMAKEICDLDREWPFPPEWRRAAAFRVLAVEDLKREFQLTAMSGYDRCEVFPLVEAGHGPSTIHGAMAFYWRTARAVPAQITTIPGALFHGLALGHAVEEQGRFLDRIFLVVSHNMRNPAAHIEGFADLLARRGQRMPEDARVDYLGRIAREAGRIRAIAEAVYHMGGCNITLEEVDCDLVAVINDAVRYARADAKHKGISIAYEAHDGLVALVQRTDPTKVSEVISLVLDNAVKYTCAKSKGVRGKATPITVAIANRPSHKKNYLEISVEDDGIGVTPEDIRVAFRPFERGKRAKEAGAEGLGIGLYAASAFVGALGGSISIGASDTGGTRCIIKLPIRS